MTEPEKWDKEDLQWQQQHDSLCAHEAKAADLETAVLLQVRLHLITCTS